MNNAAHDFAFVHYFIGRDAQSRQNEKEGFEPMICVDLDGRIVEEGETPAECLELHYVARKR